MKLNIHPHYEVLTSTKIEEVRDIITKFDKPNGIEIYDTKVLGLNGAPEISVRIYKKEGIIEKRPIIMDVHGGGFVAGNLDFDNNRATYLAMNIPAIVVSVDYRLSPENIFPAALEDCYAVWNWIYEIAEFLGGDKDRMGLFGTSAGGNLCAGLAFYVRDKGGPKISLNALNVPAIGLGPTLSAEQMRYGAPVLSGDNLSSAIKTYLGGFNGNRPSYYAVPNFADDFSGLPPTFVIVGEYDPLRDYGLEYVNHLLKDAVPCELYMMPRVGHGFDMINDAPMTKWIRDGLCMSFQREFKMI
ncbi:MAG: Alpha/beta hydrolase fold-3 domain protein [Bacillota bacterium]|jgi:acetyl esterase/lipase|nr:Alpha/beta hydrolase fold-3 domain protein [Bacillota bacterium]